MGSSKQTDVKIMEELIEILRSFLLDLLKLRESTRFTAGDDVTKEKVIITFEVSIGNHLEAIRDLLFYPTFPKPGQPVYMPAKNYHALSISVITRAMLESASILYWILQSDEKHVSVKISEYYKYIQLCHAISFQELKSPLTNEQVELIKKSKYFCTNEAQGISWKDLTLGHVRQDYYLVIEKKLGNKQGPDDKLNPTKLVTNFLAHEVKMESFDELHFKKMYGLLSDFVHAHPFAIANMFSLEASGKGGVTINFNNNAPYLLLTSLSTAIECYRYAFCALLSVFKKEKELLF